MWTFALDKIPETYRYGHIYTQSATDKHNDDEEDDQEDNSTPAARTTEAFHPVTATSIDHLLVSQLRGMKTPKMQRDNLIEFLQKHSRSTRENNIVIKAIMEYMENTKPTKPIMNKVLDSLENGIKTERPLLSAEPIMPPLPTIPRKSTATAHAATAAKRKSPEPPMDEQPTGQKQVRRRSARNRNNPLDNNK